MTLVNMLFLGILFAGLLMWMGNLVRTQGEDEKAGNHWLFFLLGGLGLSMIAIIVTWTISEYVFNMSAPVFLPIMFGFTVALGLHLVQERHKSLMKTVPLFLIFLLLLSWITISNNWGFLLLIAVMGILTVLAWLGWDQNGKRYLIFFGSEVILLGISIRVTDMSRIADMNPRWLGSILHIGTFLIIPWIGVVMSALLIRSMVLSKPPRNRLSVISTLLMVAILLLMIGYQAMLVSIWDVATDGLGWVFLLMTTSTIGIGSAMLMTWSMPRKKIGASILFALTVPTILIGAYNLANYDRDHTWGTKPVIMTERRADKIDKAIQSYYKRNHEYPQALDDLTPWYLLYIPNPYIIPGLDWCYEGGTDHYRFGYVYRQYFSTPASVKIQSSAGELSDTNWTCQDDADVYALPLGF